MNISLTRLLASRLTPFKRLKSIGPSSLLCAEPLDKGLTITAEFEQAIQLMEGKSPCIYLTGKAGTGKSTLLHYFRKRTKKRCVVLAPTGIAAINVKGETLHSFFGFPPRLVQSKHIHLDSRKRLLYQTLEMLIIDEVSMVSPDVLDGIDYSLRLHRHNLRPFGGVQLVLFGDLYQMAPVVPEALRPYYIAHYGGIYFFNARIFKELTLHYFELTTNFRQTDDAFKQALNNIRENVVSVEDLALINRQHHANLRPNDETPRLTLTTTQERAAAINGRELHALCGEMACFAALLKGKIDGATYPTSAMLQLKVGAQVMLLKNDPQKRWANGSIGVVQRIQDGSVSVDIDGKVYSLIQTTWEVIEHVYHPGHRSIQAFVVGSFRQFPLQPAWAVTIHKSQGLSLDRISIDLGAGAFAHGQTYVALSRCRSLEGLHLAQPLRRQDIIVDTTVHQFVQANRLR